MHPIARYRRAKGWTQADLAKALGVNVNSVRGWEDGAMPRPKMIAALADTLGVDRLELVDEITGWQQSGKVEAA